MMKRPSITYCTFLVLLSQLPIAHAADLYWNPQESSSNWDSTSLNWSLAPGDPGDRSWAAGASNLDIARFHSAGAALQVGAGLGAGGLRFEENGYSLTGVGSFQLNGSLPTIFVDAGKSATITGADFRITASDKRISKTGAGTLVISSGKNFFGDIGDDVAVGTTFRIAAGRVEVNGPVFRNAQSLFEVEAGAELYVNNAISARGLAGHGTILATEAIVVSGQGGTGSNFRGVLNSTAALTKANASGLQLLSGNVSNSLTGAISVTLGTLALAKTEGATAYSGNSITLGNTGSSSAVATLRLDGENQISTKANVSFVSGNRGTASLNLNGHSADLGALTVNPLYVVSDEKVGINRIDFGVNDLEQTLTFTSLTIVPTWADSLEILNFDFDRDVLRFASDPSAMLGRFKINGDDQFTFVESGMYWNVQAIPEPGSVAVLMFAGGAMLLLKRKRK